MVSTSWLAAKLNPYARWLKLAAYALAAAALVSAGWVTNGWRLGQKVANLETAAEHKEAVRQTALTERQAKAMTDALERVTASQAALNAARKENARLVLEASQKAPEGPEWACRDKPLPEDYVGDFRQ